jgi:hypothetical protein
MSSGGAGNGDWSGLGALGLVAGLLLIGVEAATLAVSQVT